MIQILNRSFIIPYQFLTLKSSVNMFLLDILLIYEIKETIYDFTINFYLKILLNFLNNFWISHYYFRSLYIYFTFSQRLGNQWYIEILTLKCLKNYHLFLSTTKYKNIHQKLWDLQEQPHIFPGNKGYSSELFFFFNVKFQHLKNIAQSSLVHFILCQMWTISTIHLILSCQIFLVFTLI